MIAYRYGMTFTPGKWDGEPPTLPDVFPFWSEDEINKMELDALRQKMMRWASTPIARNKPGEIPET